MRFSVLASPTSQILLIYSVRCHCQTFRFLQSLYLGARLRAHITTAVMVLRFIAVYILTRACKFLLCKECWLRRLLRSLRLHRIWDGTAEKAMGKDFPELLRKNFIRQLINTFTPLMYGLIRPETIM